MNDYVVSSDCISLFCHDDVDGLRWTHSDGFSDQPQAGHHTHYTTDTPTHPHHTSCYVSTLTFLLMSPPFVCDFLSFLVLIPPLLSATPFLFIAHSQSLAADQKKRNTKKKHKRKYPTDTIEATRGRNKEKESVCCTSPFSSFPFRCHLLLRISALEQVTISNRCHMPFIGEHTHTRETSMSHLLQVQVANVFCVQYRVSVLLVNRAL